MEPSASALPQLYTEDMYFSTMPAVQSDQDRGSEIPSPGPSSVNTGRQVIVSNELFTYFETIVDFWIIFLIACLGIVTNAINMAVFTRQGFKDGINLSMMSIALWDFLKCFSGLVHRLYGPISLVSPPFATSWRNFTFPYVEYTPIFAGYVSYALASYVSIERCLCVSMPFKVKSVFTPKLTFCMVSIISVVVYGAYVVMYFIYDIVWVYSPSFNTTIAKYTYSEFYYTHGNVVMVYYKIVAILLPFGSFIILCVCSATTVYFLRESSKSLQDINKEKTEKKENISQREKQVVKMLLVVIVVYIGNLFPRIVFYIAQLAEPEFYVLRRYNNVFLTTAKFIFILDFTNASINLFIFLKMSSNFRSTFLEMFGSHKQV